MKIFIVLASVVLATTAISDQESWQNFKLTYGKGYKSLLDEKRRYTIFQENLRTIEDHNAKYENGEVTYKLGLNQFADMTKEEFSLQLRLHSTAIPTKQNNTIFFTPKNVEIPNEIDWRLKGAVTDVKNQGNCGSCWAFSTVGALEGQNFLANGELVSLSPQELVDCDAIDAGCNGGLMETAFDYIALNGLASEESYPYTGTDGICKHNDSKIVVRSKGYVNVDINEDALQAAVATKGPIAAAVDASDFHLYSSGIFKDPSCINFPFALNHGILVVGYGTSDGEDYWTIKNSWGSSWGEDGYIRLARNAQNHCGVADEASYPVM